MLEACILTLWHWGLFVFMSPFYFYIRFAVYMFTSSAWNFHYFSAVLIDNILWYVLYTYMFMCLDVFYDERVLFVLDMPPPTIGGITFSGYPSGSPSFYSFSINTYFAWCNVSLFSGGIWMKLDVNIHHVCGHWWKGFESQRSMSWPVSPDHLTCNGGGMHFDIVALTLTLFMSPFYFYISMFLSLSIL